MGAFIYLMFLAIIVFAALLFNALDEVRSTIDANIATLFPNRNTTTYTNLNAMWLALPVIVIFVSIVYALQGSQPTSGIDD